MNKKDDIDILARTLYGEARGKNEGRTGRVAVACVVMNRMKADKKHLTGYVKVGTAKRADVAATCLKPWQFSCWLSLDPNRPKIETVTKDNPIFCECLAIAALAVNGNLPDITNGAAHYYNPKACKKPKWVIGKKPCFVCGSHFFFNDIN